MNRFKDISESRHQNQMATCSQFLKKTLLVRATWYNNACGMKKERTFSIWKRTILSLRNTLTYSADYWDVVIIMSQRHHKHHYHQQQGAGAELFFHVAAPAAVRYDSKMYVYYSTTLVSGTSEAVFGGLCRRFQHLLHRVVI